MNEAAILFEKMVRDFANQTITNEAAGSITKLFPSIRYSNEQNNHTSVIGL